MPDPQGSAPTRHMVQTAVGRLAGGKFSYAARCSCGFPGDGVIYLLEADAIEALRLLHLDRRAFMTEDRTGWVDVFVGAAS